MTTIRQALYPVADIDTLIFVTRYKKRATEDHFDVYYELKTTPPVKDKHERAEIVKILFSLAWNASSCASMKTWI